MFMSSIFIHSCLHLSGDKIVFYSENWYLVYTEALVLRDKKVVVGLIFFLIWPLRFTQICSLWDYSKQKNTKTDLLYFSSLAGYDFACDPNYERLGSETVKVLQEASSNST